MICEVCILYIFIRPQKTKKPKMTPTNNLFIQVSLDDSDGLVAKKKFPGHKESGFWKHFVEEQTRLPEKCPPYKTCHLTMNRRHATCLLVNALSNQTSCFWDTVILQIFFYAINVWALWSCSYSRVISQYTHKVSFADACPWINWWMHSFPRWGRFQHAGLGQ